MQININLGNRIEMLILRFATDQLYILNTFFVLMQIYRIVH